MALTVKHLNGDTTFLLTFSPTSSRPPSPPASGYYQTPGTFTILIDPWLSGPSSMWHRRFLLSQHTSPSCVEHLSQLPEPNVVIISQAKPDHCHESTLRQLDPESPITTILAEPVAAKKIRGMRFFYPDMVHSLRPYSERDPDSVIRFCIPPIVAGGTSGEATISFMPAKMDVAGVHNAIGITYRPPSTTNTPSRPFTPKVAPAQHPASLCQHPYTSLPITPPESPVYRSTSNTSSTVGSSELNSTFSAPNHSRSFSSSSSLYSVTRRSVPTEKALSVIYSPHGVSYSLIRSYASSFLIQKAALPLTLLLHSFDRVDNPWWMGGNVAAGLPGGVEIARNLMARCWVSAHDEDKINTGISVKNVRTQKFSQQEAMSAMVEDGTKVLNLGVGEEILMRSR
ncbi:uncharacterized protein KY384_002570 [Bacidia gigantensis]|uniref:uncharacterized protein n=1 Tax=Bacidia gigantensis TaxID=2732470 RepID=UPI001D0386A9|nr:uncharacterized protein KY384_002570 [Bacidia gigantensis]KAG8532693.1 hypothetical protein KY384_002570 [Bacidia gigantensis]